MFDIECIALEKMNELFNNVDDSIALITQMIQTAWSISVNRCHFRQIFAVDLDLIIPHSALETC